MYFFILSGFSFMMSFDGQFAFFANFEKKGNEIIFVQDVALIVYNNVDHEKHLLKLKTPMER